MPAPIRGSDVHVSEDIRRMLRALAATHEAAQQVYGASSDYQMGNTIAGIISEFPELEKLIKSAATLATYSEPDYSAGFLDGLCAMAEGLGIPFQVGQGNVALGYRWEG